MAGAAKVTITNVSRVFSAEAARRGKEDAQVMYTVTIGDGQQAKSFQGTLQMPWESYTLAAVQAKIKELEAQRIATVGQTFTI